MTLRLCTPPRVAALALALALAAGCPAPPAPPPAAPPVVVAPAPAAAFATAPVPPDRPALRLCTPRPAPPDSGAAALERARRAAALGHPLSIALETSAHWEPGRVLRVAFHGGRTADRKAVLDAAAEWSKYANVRLVGSVDPASEIRCAFDQAEGSWSYVGAECLSIPLNQPTMNMGWRDDPARDLHEVGHALGFVHEHQLPDSKIPWDRAKLYRYFGGPPNYWPPAAVDAQILDRLDAREITNFGWDRNSIMEYSFPPEVLTDPSRAVPWNKSLSPEDKASAARVYPR